MATPSAAAGSGTELQALCLRVCAVARTATSSGADPSTALLAAAFLNLFKDPASGVATAPPGDYTQAIAPSQMCDVATVEARVRAGNAYTHFTDCVLELRRVYINALRYNYQGTLGFRKAAHQVLDAVDDALEKDAQFRARLDEDARADGQAAWTPPRKAFAHVMACRTALEHVYKTASAESVKWFQYPVAFFGTDMTTYRSEIGTPTCLADVCDALYSGNYTAVELFQAHVSTVFDNAIKWWSAPIRREGGDAVIAAARRIKAMFEDMLKKQLQMDTSARRVVAAASAAPPATLAAPAWGSAATTTAVSAAPTVSTSMSSSHLPACKELLKRMRTLKAYSKKVSRELDVSHLFLYPVDTTRFTEYLYIIDFPVSIVDIERKLYATPCEYASPLEMKADVELMVRNAFKFNIDIPTNADTRWYVKKFSEEFAKTWKSLFPYESSLPPARSERERYGDPPVRPPRSLPPPPAPAAVVAPAPKLKLKLRTGAPSTQGATATAVISADDDAAVPARAVESESAVTDGSAHVAAEHPSVPAPAAAATAAAHVPGPMAEVVTAAAGDTVASMPLDAARLAPSAPPVQQMDAVSSAADAVVAATETPAAVVAPKLRLHRSVREPAYAPPGSQLQRAAHTDGNASGAVTVKLKRPPAASVHALSLPLARDWRTTDHTSTEYADARSSMWLLHGAMKRIMSHGYAPMFANPWIQTAPDTYSAYALALSQPTGLQGIWDVVRWQTSALVEDSIKINKTREKERLDARARAAAGSLEYANVGTALDGLHDVLRTAMEIHADGVWTGDTVQAHEIRTRALQLQWYANRVIVEYFADSVPALMTEREAYRAECSQLVEDSALLREPMDTHKVCMSIVKRMMGKSGRYAPRNRWFMAPVGIIFPGIPPIYYQLIQVPMDFSTVVTKLEGAHYATHGAFAEDMRRIFTNAMTYNEHATDDAGRTVLEDAQHLLLEFNALWAEHSIDIADAVMRANEEHKLADERDSVRRVQQEAFDRVIKHKQEQVAAALSKSTAAEQLAHLLEAVAIGEPAPVSTLAEDDALLVDALAAAPEQRAKYLQGQLARVRSSMPAATLARAKFDAAPEWGRLADALFPRVEAPWSFTPLHAPAHHGSVHARAGTKRARSAEAVGTVAPAAADGAANAGTAVARTNTALSGNLWGELPPSTRGSDLMELEESVAPAAIAQHTSAHFVLSAHHAHIAFKMTARIGAAGSSPALVAAPTKSAVTTAPVVEGRRSRGR